VRKKLISYFPKDYEPSTGQINIIKKVDECFSSNNKFCIVSAPTGTGKSFLSTTLANASNSPTESFKKLITTYSAYKQDAFGNYINQVECEKEPPFGAFTLTITKNLQDQYKDLFEDASLFKGKSNYICAIDNVSTVETAPCLFAPRLKDDCWAACRCPYYNNRNIALLSKHTVLNYKMFLHLPPHLKRKNYIICDEASELENEIVKMYSLFLDVDKLKNLGLSIKKPKTTFFKDIYDWLSLLSINLSEYIESLIKQCNKNTNIVLGEKNRILYFKNLYMQITQTLTEWNSCEWVIDELDKNCYSITPLKIDALTKHIFNFADQVVLMSATIIDHKKFADSLGIKKYVYVEEKSNFSPEKSPIYISKTNAINYSNKQVVLPKIAKQILELCDTYKTEKGIIHTQSMDITNILQKFLKGDRFLFRDDLRNNDDILNSHYNSSKPTVLVSPSLSYGVDLRDDLARFCIIVKLPYLPLGNKRVKRLFDRDKQWYQNQMLNTLVQMCGRATRSKQDYSTTYILDGNGYKVLPQVIDKLPAHFVDRIK
jgi:ATP-dependent DNA helicase DinG